MAFIITSSCIGTTDGACVDVCPVDCIYSKPGDTHLFINPDECIDCALCEPECPVDAIYAEDELPEDQQEYLKLNAELAEVWPNLTEKKEPLPEAEQWADKPNKLQYLER